MTKSNETKPHLHVRLLLGLAYFEYERIFTALAIEAQLYPLIFANKPHTHTHTHTPPPHVAPPTLERTQARHTGYVFYSSFKQLLDLPMNHIE